MGRKATFRERDVAMFFWGLSRGFKLRGIPSSFPKNLFNRLTDVSEHIVDGGKLGPMDEADVIRLDQTAIDFGYPGAVGHLESADEEVDGKGLTPKESAVINLTADCWNAYLASLEDLSSGIDDDDIRNFRDAIHTCQRIVFAKFALRQLDKTVDGKENGK